MQDVFAPLTAADYTFLAGLIEGPLTLTEDQKLHGLLAELDGDQGLEARAALDAQLEREIRYLGSADLAYLARYLSGQTPGVSFGEIIRDVAKALKVEAPAVGTYPEQLAALVEAYVTRQFADLSPEAQQQMLEDLGVDRKEAAAFLKRSAGVFALPVMIQAFNTIIVEGLIKRIIFGTIARIIGQQLAQRLLTFIAGRFPWWVAWIGPAAWSLSLGWTALDLQGPARRKTIPVVLYLGLCTLRKEGEKRSGP